MSERHYTELTEEEKDVQAILIQQSIKADLEEMIIAKTSIKDRIRELEHTLGILKARQQQRVDRAGAR